MRMHEFRNNEDPFRFIVCERFGIDIDAAAISGDATRIDHVQRLLDGLEEVYRMGYEDCERYVATGGMLEECVVALDTAFLLAIHRNDADLRARVLTEIQRRAASGTDPVVAFALPLAEQDG